MLNNSSSFSDSRGEANINMNQQDIKTSDLPPLINLSNSASSIEYKNSEVSNSDLNGSTIPMSNRTGDSQVNTNTNESENNGIFSRISNFFKNLNPWKIEEEEFYDAHGFKCKRPKTKIPLRKKGQSYEDDIQKAGGQSMVYATQHSGFGNMFI